MKGFRGHARNAAAMWEALSRRHAVVLMGTERVRIVAPSPYHALRAIILDPVPRQLDIAGVARLVHLPSWGTGRGGVLLRRAHRGYGGGPGRHE